MSTFGINNTDTLVFFAYLPFLSLLLSARHLRETCVFRFVKHDNTVRGVDYTGVSDSEELTAQITFLVHILSRDGQPVFPNSKQETFMLLDGRVVTLQLDEDGCIKEVRSAVEYSIYR